MGLRVAARKMLERALGLAFELGLSSLGLGLGLPFELGLAFAFESGDDGGVSSP